MAPTHEGLLVLFWSGPCFGVVLRVGPATRPLDEPSGPTPAANDPGAPVRGTSVPGTSGAIVPRWCERHQERYPRAVATQEGHTKETT